jgi:hypothetical protein
MNELGSSLENVFKKSLNLYMQQQPNHVAQPCSLHVHTLLVVVGRYPILGRHERTVEVHATKSEVQEFQRVID